MSYTRTAQTKFQVKSWQESVLEDIDEAGTTRNGVYYPTRGLTRADVEYAYEGDMEGTSRTVMLISYKEDAAPVLAFERFEGSIGGYQGSCMFQHVGTQDSSSVRDRAVVVPGMGTGGLATLRGEAEIVLEGHSDEGYGVTLRYEIG